METIEKKQQILLFTRGQDKPLKITRTVRGIHFDKLFMRIVGEIMYDGFYVAVGQNSDGTWDGPNPRMSAKERARMFLEEDR